MSLERARQWLKKWDLDRRILEFDTSSATVELAAQAASRRGSPRACPLR